MGLLEQLASGLLNYSRSEPEGLLARGLRQPAGLLGRGLNNAINMPGPGLLAQQDAFFRPSVMATPQERRAQGAAFLQNIASGPFGMAPLGWTAFHGSPHKFDKFSMDKIGTGEGAQAYGHGLYFADNPEVAKSYATTTRMEHKVTGKVVDSRDVPTGKMSEYKPAQNLYRVDIDDARAPKEAFLDWDKPLSQQSESVQKGVHAALREQGIAGSVADYIIANRSGRDALTAIARGEYSPHLMPPDGAASARASEVLRKAGIPGIRYLDAGSRAGGGTHNTVLFDDSLVKILGRE